MIYEFLTTGFEVVEATTPIDLLRRAKIDITTISLTDNVAVESSSHVCVVADKLFSQCNFDDIDGIILPGGPGTFSLFEHKGLCKLILEQYNKGNPICAICAGPSILAKLGIKNKSTVYPTMSAEVPNYQDVDVCVDDNVITASGVGTAIPFALEIISHIKGEENSKQIANSIVYYK